MSQTLLERIAQKKAHVGVIGQGYVGLPLALVFQEAGFTVTGFDVDAKKVAAIGRGDGAPRIRSPRTSRNVVRWQLY